MQKQGNENLLEASIASKASSGKPQGLPDKFWDAESGIVKIEELLMDYNSLIQRDDNLVEQNIRKAPENYNQYSIKSASPLLEPDEEIFKRFYEKVSAMIKLSWFMIWQPKEFCRY